MKLRNRLISNQSISFSNISSTEAVRVRPEAASPSVVHLLAAAASMRDRNNSARLRIEEQSLKGIHPLDENTFGDDERESVN